MGELARAGEAATAASDGKGLASAAALSPRGADARPARATSESALRRRHRRRERAAAAMLAVRVRVTDAAMCRRGGEKFVEYALEVTAVPVSSEAEVGGGRP
eukprot:CAMPEP_0203819616 /NCGR_PEP_ID=MMETSP0115-20131106/36774_1 /ASSEMBLY_ACC=CAM_ASM_000227 /TAXON_ID=33651 /ORGANISM="Bicosoecid sp, Strain ms1" /LENGTH=101 /DNA_ID=CAMNT_0050728605 /DNA_START=147 /DNA_END=448 /DNA_ORIENTATION=-